MVGASLRHSLAGLLAAGFVLVGAAYADTPPDALSETYRDWVVACRSSEVPGRRRCELSQELRQAEGGQRILRIALQVDEDGQTGLLTMITPFGLKVSGDVGISVDDTLIASLPFNTCLAAGCIVQGEIAESSVAQLQRSGDATIALPTTGGGQLEITVSLIGFSAAWNRLKGM